MKNKNIKRKLSKPMIVIPASIIFFLIFIFPSFRSASSEIVLNFNNPSYGPANIEGEKLSYYYFRSKISSKQKTNLSFGEKDCIIFDSEGKSFSKCWIYVAGWSPGLSISQRAPVMMKTLIVQLSADESIAPHKWNTSRVDGPKGALEFGIPDGGFVEVYFIWQVKKGFKASRVKIGDNLEITF